MELKAVPDAARVAAYRFGTAVRLLRNICLWNNILAFPVLEKIALNELLCGKILPHLHSIQGNVHEAMIRTERVVASLYDVWTGPSVTGDHRYILASLYFISSLSLFCSSFLIIGWMLITSLALKYSSK